MSRDNKDQKLSSGNNYGSTNDINKFFTQFKFKQIIPLKEEKENRNKQKIKPLNENNTNIINLTKINNNKNEVFNAFIGDLDKDLTTKEKENHNLNLDIKKEENTTTL